MIKCVVDINYALHIKVASQADLKTKIIIKSHRQPLTERKEEKKKLPNQKSIIIFSVKKSNKVERVNAYAISWVEAEDYKEF